MFLDIGLNENWKIVYLSGDNSCFLFFLFFVFYNWKNILLSYVTKVNLCLVSVSNYVPNTSLVPLNLPYIIETFCKYPWCSRWGVNSFVLCASVCLKWFFKKN